MVALSLIASFALFASAAFAAPSKVSDIQKRGYKFNPSGGWNGAIQTGQTGVSTVSATVSVPTPSTPPGGPSGMSYAGGAWVGIDGYGSSPLWQTGIGWTVSGSDVTFSGWWDWCSNAGCGATTYSGFSVSAGDTIVMTVSSSGAGSSGTATLINTSTGHSWSKTLTGQYGTLSGTTAEWIIEDPGISTGPAPFADFGTVTFSGCGYTDSSGSNGVSGALFTVTTTQPNGQTVDSVSQTGANSFVLTYNGTSY